MRSGTACSIQTVEVVYVVQDQHPRELIISAQKTPHKHNNKDLSRLQQLLRGVRVR